MLATCQRTSVIPAIPSGMADPGVERADRRLTVLMGNVGKITYRKWFSRDKSEMPHNAARNKYVVLATLARVNIELRHARPEISGRKTQAEAAKNFHVESQAGLEDTGGSSRIGRAYAEMAKSEGRQCGRLFWMRARCMRSSLKGFDFGCLCKLEEIVLRVRPKLLS